MTQSDDCQFSCSWGVPFPATAWGVHIVQMINRRVNQLSHEEAYFLKRAPSRDDAAHVENHSGGCQGSEMREQGTEIGNRKIHT
jgi:hypothetical protein